jgi:hypothetical protein
MTSLADRSPVEIDTELARIWEAIQRHQAQCNGARKNARYYAQQGRMAAADRFEAEAVAIESKIAALRVEAEPLEAEYARRRWNRYFLVTNSNGHVHRGMMCQTCFATTQYAWLIDLADCVEDEMIRAYGEKACTVCFPDAPANPHFAGPGSRDREAVEARQAEKAARDNAKAAKLLVAPLDLGDEWGEGRGMSYDRIETVAAAKQALRDAASAVVTGAHEVAQIASGSHWTSKYPNHDADADVIRYGMRVARMQARIPVLRAALEAKGLTAAELDTIIERAEKKARKEAGI